MKTPYAVLIGLASASGALGRRKAEPDPDLEPATVGPAACRVPTAGADRGSDDGRRRAADAVVAAYVGDVYRLLVDVADRAGLSLAYVDRGIVEAHLERDLSDREWAAFSGRLIAMAFDDHVGDHGTFRTDWIEDRLAQAGVAGRRRTTAGQIVEPSCGRLGGRGAGVAAAGPCDKAGLRRR